MEFISNIAAQVGFNDLKRLGRRTGLTCRAFLLANTIGPLFFEKYPIRAGYAFALTQAVTVNLLFDNKKIEELTDKLKRNTSPQLEEFIDVARFVLIMLTPIVLAKWMTYPCSRGLTWKGTAWISAYNCTAGLISLYNYKSPD